MSRGLAFGILVMALLAAPGLMALQQPAPVQLMTPNEGVALVRQLNTILGKQYVRTNNYTTLSEVVADDTFTRQQGFALVNANIGTYKRYRVTIAHVEDGQSYQLSVVPFTGCGQSWFSNETGLIFTGNCLQ